MQFPNFFHEFFFSFTRQISSWWSKSSTQNHQMQFFNFSSTFLIFSNFPFLVLNSSFTENWGKTLRHTRNVAERTESKKNDPNWTASGLWMNRFSYTMHDFILILFFCFSAVCVLFRFEFSQSSHLLNPRKIPLIPPTRHMLWSWLAEEITIGKKRVSSVWLCWATSDCVGGDLICVDDFPRSYRAHSTPTHANSIILSRFHVNDDEFAGETVTIFKSHWMCCEKKFF